MRISILLVFAFLSVSGIFAQEQEATSSSFESLVEEVAQAEKGNKVGIDSILKEMQSAPPTTGDSLILAKYHESLKAYYDYRIFGFKHRAGVFSWQMTSTKVIFFMVNLLVLAGIFFSWMQFKKGLSEKEAPTTETEVELSIKSIKIKSSIIGLIILVLSLVFFYLYLVYIYPIREIF